MNASAHNVKKGLWLGLLGVTLFAATLAFGLAVIATVFVGKKMPVGTSHAPVQAIK